MRCTVNESLFRPWPEAMGISIPPLARAIDQPPIATNPPKRNRCAIACAPCDCAQSRAVTIPHPRCLDTTTRAAWLFWKTPWKVRYPPTSTRCVPRAPTGSFHRGDGCSRIAAASPHCSSPATPPCPEPETSPLRGRPRLDYVLATVPSVPMITSATPLGRSSDCERTNRDELSGLSGRRLHSHRDSTH